MVYHMKKRLLAAESICSNIEGKALAIQFHRYSTTLFAEKYSNQSLTINRWNSIYPLQRFPRQPLREFAGGLSLKAFDYDDNHQKRRKTPHADALSRLHFQNIEHDALGATNVYSEVNVATCKYFL